MSVFGNYCTYLWYKIEEGIFLPQTVLFECSSCMVLKNV